MRVNLHPQRRDDTLVAFKSGDVLNLNGEIFDFSGVGEDGTLPYEAFQSTWIGGAINRVDGELIIPIILPLPWNYSQEQAFPVPLENVPDGLLVFPGPNMPEGEVYVPPTFDGSTSTVPAPIDWSLLITKEMKDAEAAARVLAAAKVELASRNAIAAAQIARIEDRITTIGYSVELEEATEEELAELAALQPQLLPWKKYKADLGKVTKQATWPTAPVWPKQPPIPQIEASPMGISPDDQLI